MLLDVEERRSGYEGTAQPSKQGKLSERRDGEVVRKALIMNVDPGRASEYERRHQRIWPEMEDTLREHGVITYSIFIDHVGSRLFAYLEVESEERWESIGRSPVCQKWWAYMKDIMPCNPDNSPISEEMREVFHID
jgi:L-rhamnose mutarotase